MKRILGNNGFALVETLIVTVSVVSIFGMLYTLVYPLKGEYEASEKYEDLDTKYVAFYLKKMLETDNTLTFAEVRDNYANHNALFETKAFECVKQGSGCKLVNGVVQYKNTPVAAEDIYLGDESEKYTYTNDFCENLDNAEDPNVISGDVKNNRYICNQYMHAARVKNIILTKYKNRTLTESDVSTRSFKEYIRTLPTHGYANSSHNNSLLLIVEVEHDSSTNSRGVYYTYASIEVLPW